MAREYAIPSSSTILQDFGLAVTSPPTSRNRRVVIIGTAEDGPLYEPVVVDVPQDSEFVWGRQSQGDLVRGIFECWNSQGDNQNVVGVRIGNAKTSLLELGEINSTEIDEENSDTNITSLRLTGRFPGPIYDQITVQYDTGINHAGDVSIYNPKTGLYSYFTVDRQNPYNSSAQAHNIAELVDSINLDRNCSSVLTAEYDELNTNFELAISGTTPGVIQSETNVRFDLQRILAESGVIVDGDDAFLVTNPDLPYGLNDVDSHKNLTIANNLIRLIDVETVGVSEWMKQDFKGNTTELEFLPLDGKGTARWDSIQAMKDYDGDSKWITNPSGEAVVSEFIYTVDNMLINEIPTDYKGYDEQNTFNFSIDLPFDDTESPYISSAPLDSGVVRTYLSGTLGYEDYAGVGGVASGLFEDARCLGIEDKADEFTGEDYRPYGALRLWVSNDIAPEGTWTELPYHPQSGVYISEFVEATAGSDAKAVFSIGTELYATMISGEYVPSAALSGLFDGTASAEVSFDTGIPNVDAVKWSNMTDLIDTDGFIKDQSFIRVTGNTVKSFISEVETLSQLEAIASPTPTHYFIRGQEMILNSSAPFPMVFNYGTRIKYEIDTTVSLSDASAGEITFPDQYVLPGPGGGPLQNDVVSHIRFNYEYMPNWPAITSKAKSLYGGTTGSKITTKEREEEFRKAYDYLRNFEGDIWVPMGAYIDEIKQDYSETTGLLEDMTNSYAQDIEDFLEEQSINLYQPHAVLGVTTIDGTTLGERDAWVENLTEYDIDDPTRGANVMNSIQNKFMSVASFEPVFLNTGRGQPYSANGQAAYAGLIASLPYDISPTNKAIPGIYATRFPLSMGQLEALNGNRYVTLKTSDVRTPVIVNDITAAPLGSDFVNWSIFSITKEAADRIKRLADNYIGRPNSIEVRNALDQDISNILKGMAGVQAFNFSIASTIEQQVLGVIEIDLVIVPVFTIKKIRTTIKLRRNVALG